MGPTIVLGAALASVALWFWLRPAPGLPSVPPAAAAIPAAPASAAQQLVAKAWVLLNQAGMGRPELELAGDYCQQAVALAPTDADAWAAWSQVESWNVYYAFDDSLPRREAARSRAERALQLSPRSFEARLARACYLVRGRATSGVTSAAPEAEPILRDLLRERPAEPRALFVLGILLRDAGRKEEMRATFDALARNPDFAAIAWNEIGWAALVARDLAGAEAAADKSIAIQPYIANLCLKIQFVLYVRGDLDAAAAAVEKLSESARQDDFGAMLAMWTYIFRREWDKAVQALAPIAREQLRSPAGSGPRSAFLGYIYSLAGRDGLAEIEWKAALRVVERRLAEVPNDASALSWKGTIMAFLGDRVGARKVLQVARELRGLNVRKAEAFDHITLGEWEEAVAAFEQATPEGLRDWDLTAASFRYNPRFDPLRQLPSFQKLLARLEAEERRLMSGGPAAVTAPAGQKPGDSSMIGAAEDRSAQAPRPDQKSVAVLAFANLSDDKANEYFSDGISEELLNVLAKVPGLKVTARTSSFHFKGRDTPVPEIARQLGVAYVVEGSVRKSGDKVRITAQLIKAADGFHVWSDTFTRDLKDVFAVQDEIAGLVAKNLEAKLGAAPRTEAMVDGRALELYMQGRAAWNRRNAEGFDRAEALFRQALAIAPDFARAHAALADVWMIRAISDDKLSRYGQRASPVIQPIEAEAMRALELDPESAEAHATLGFLRQLQHRPGEALRLLRRSVELNPNYPTGHHWLAGILAYQSWFDECIAEYRRAVAVDPLSPRILDNFGWTLVTLGRLQEGLEFIDRALALQPNEPQALAHRVFTLARLGRREEARALGAKVADRYRLAVLAETGDRAAIEAALPAAQGPERGLLLSALGRQDEALDDFQADDIILEDNQDWFFDPRLVPWHQDPRFRKVVDELGFEDNLARALAWVAAHPPEKPKARP